MYCIVNFPSYNIKIDLADIVEAHCYVEYKVDLVNFERHICVMYIAGSNQQLLNSQLYTN